MVTDEAYEGEAPTEGGWGVSLSVLCGCTDLLGEGEEVSKLFETKKKLQHGVIKQR